MKTTSHLCRLSNSYSCLGKTVNLKVQFKVTLIHERKIKQEAKCTMLMNVKALTVNYLPFGNS